MLKLIKNSTLVAIAALSFHLLALTPPTYQEKIEQIREKVTLRFNGYGSELDRVASINQIHDLIFNSDKSAYFSKESGLIRTISLNEYRGFTLDEEDIAGIVELRGHELKWPTNLPNIRELVENSLNDEQSYMMSLLEIKHRIANTYDKLRYSRTESYESPSNRAYLDNLSNLVSALDADNLSKRKFAAHPHLTLDASSSSMQTPGVELYFGYDWENTPYNTAKLTLGYSGIFYETSFMSQESLGLALRIALVDRIGVLARYWMKSDAFAASLQNFNALLEDAEIKQLLKDNKVHNVEFDEEFRSKTNLFENNKLTLGTTIDDMKLVINLLFR